MTIPIIVICAVVIIIFCAYKVKCLRKDINTERHQGAKELRQEQRQGAKEQSQELCQGAEEQRQGADSPDVDVRLEPVIKKATELDFELSSILNGLNSQRRRKYLIDVRRGMEELDPKIRKITFDCNDEASETDTELCTITCILPLTAATIDE